jgi:hypothetical protein
MFGYTPHKSSLADKEETLRVVHHAIKALNNLIDHHVNKERYKDPSQPTVIELLCPLQHSTIFRNGIHDQIYGCVEIKRKKFGGEWSSSIHHPLMNDLLYSIGFSVCDHWSYSSEYVRFPIQIDGKTKICEIAEKCHKIIYGEIPEEVQIAHLKALGPTPG